MNKENWEIKKLGEIGQIITGSTPKTSESRNYSSDDYCFIKPSDFSTSIKEIHDSEFYISKYAYKKSRQIPVGSIMVTCIGNIGNVAINKIECTTNQQINSVIPSSDINSKYLAYSIFHKREYLQYIANAPVVPILNKTNFSNVEIPILPLSVQEAIVKELDTLHRLKELQEEQLTEYDNLAQSTFYSMFGDPVENDRGWEVNNLENISLRKGEYGSGSSAIPYEKNKPRYIRITDINEKGELNEEKVSPSNNIDFEKYQLFEGDVLFARSGATVGKTYLHSLKNGNCIYAGYLIRFIVNKEKINPKFLFHYTKTKFYKDWIISQQRAVAQPNINAKQYGELSVFIPPLSLQNQFAERIEKIEEQKELVKKSIEQTQMLIDYTMDKYFG